MSPYPRRKRRLKLPASLTPADVAAEARRQGVDPTLAVAVARHESAGNPRARSPKGAYGVMQLMPATGRRLAARLGERYDPQDAQQNVRLGVSYLGELSERFGGDTDLTLAGYNAGEGAVDRYGGVPPYRETRNYVRKIRGTMASLGERPLAHPVTTADEPTTIGRTLPAPQPAGYRASGSDLARMAGLTPSDSSPASRSARRLFQDVAPQWERSASGAASPIVDYAELDGRRIPLLGVSDRVRIGASFEPTEIGGRRVGELASSLSRERPEWETREGLVQYTLSDRTDPYKAQTRVTVDAEKIRRAADPVDEYLRQVEAASGRDGLFRRLRREGYFAQENVDATLREVLGRGKREVPVDLPVAEFAIADAYARGGRLLADETRQKMADWRAGYSNAARAEEAARQADAEWQRAHPGQAMLRSIAEGQTEEGLRLARPLLRILGSLPAQKDDLVQLRFLKTILGANALRPLAESSLTNPAQIRGAFDELERRRRVEGPSLARDISAGVAAIPRYALPALAAGGPPGVIASGVLSGAAGEDFERPEEVMRGALTGAGMTAGGLGASGASRALSARAAQALAEGLTPRLGGDLARVIGESVGTTANIAGRTAGGAGLGGGAAAVSGGSPEEITRAALTGAALGNLSSPRVETRGRFAGYPRFEEPLAGAEAGPVRPELPPGAPQPPRAPLQLLAERVARATEQVAQNKAEFSRGRVPTYPAAAAELAAAQRELSAAAPQSGLSAPSPAPEITASVPQAQPAQPGPRFKDSREARRELGKIERVYGKKSAQAELLRSRVGELEKSEADRLLAQFPNAPQPQPGEQTTDARLRELGGLLRNLSLKAGPETGERISALSQQLAAELRLTEKEVNTRALRLAAGAPSQASEARPARTMGKASEEPAAAAAPAEEAGAAEPEWRRMERELEARRAVEAEGAQREAEARRRRYEEMRRAEAEETRLRVEEQREADRIAALSRFSETAPPDPALSREARLARRRLHRFIIDEGGIRPSVANRGELRQTTVKEGGRIGVWNRRGIPADEMRARAEEAGYGPFEDEQDFLRQTVEDLFGQRVAHSGAFLPPDTPETGLARGEAEIAARFDEAIARDRQFRRRFDRLTAQPGPESVAAFLSAARERGFSEQDLAEVIPAQFEAQQRGEGVQPTPEAPETIAAQMEALRAGRRQAVLMTPGTPEGAVPAGMRRVKTEVGVFIAPRSLPTRRIRRAVRAGAYHRLLGLVEPKSAATTETVVARDEQGRELQSALVSPERLREQAESFARAYPEAVIETGDARLAVQIVEERGAARLQRSERSREAAQREAEALAAELDAERLAVRATSAEAELARHPRRARAVELLRQAVEGDARGFTDFVKGLGYEEETAQEIIRHTAANKQLRDELARIGEGAGRGVSEPAAGLSSQRNARETAQPESLTDAQARLIGRAPEATADAEFDAVMTALEALRNASVRGQASLPADQFARLERRIRAFKRERQRRVKAQRLAPSSVLYGDPPRYLTKEEQDARRTGGDAARTAAELARPAAGHQADSAAHAAAPEAGEAGAEALRAIQPTTIPASETPEPAPEIIPQPLTATDRIQDFGEKIGGARKDTARPLGKRAEGAGERDTRPVWRRKYDTIRIAQGAGAGRWEIIRDGRPTRQTFGTQAEAEAAIPLFEAARTHLASATRTGRSESVEYAIWRRIGERKRVIVKAGFESYEAANRYLAAHPEEIINHRFSFPEKPWLDRIERTGPERRTGNVSPQMFQETFGFRGGEFGNWNLGSDGQAALNHAYDALLDLAEALNLPPRTLSLGGELAIAFGARGHGGLRAARAHYEPARGVINLTKIRGAGTLAHEWFHALDHYLARIDGKTARERAGGVYRLGASHHATEGFSHATEARAELIAAFKNVVNTMTGKEVTEPVRDDLAQQAADRMSANLKQTLDDLRRDFLSDTSRYNKRYKPATEEQIAEWDALAARILAGEAGAKLVIAPGAARGMWRESYQPIEDLNRLYKAAQNRGFATMNENSRGRRLFHQINGMLEARQRVAQAAEGATKTRRQATDFFRAARSIDDYRVSDYWSTPTELGARAFEAYVHDKLLERASRSDYLAHGVENRDYALTGMKPYPEGAEREAINQAFDRLFATLQTRETERGVALFSRSDEQWNPPPRRRQMRPEEVAAGIRAEFAKTEAGKEGVLWINRQAMLAIDVALKFIERAEKPVVRRPGSFNGLTLTRERASQVARQLENFAARAGQEASRGYLELAGEIKYAMSQADVPGIVLVRRDLANSEAVVRHERGIHLTQITLGGGSARSHLDPGWLTQHDLFERVRKRLLARGYAEEDIAVEVPAWIIEGRWRQIGLAQYQAEDLLMAYLGAVYDRYGAGGLEMFADAGQMASETVAFLRKEQADERREDLRGADAGGLRGVDQRGRTVEAPSAGDAGEKSEAGGSDGPLFAGQTGARQGGGGRGRPPAGVSSVRSSEAGRGLTEGPTLHSGLPHPEEIGRELTRGARRLLLGPRRTAAPWGFAPEQWLRTTQAEMAGRDATAEQAAEVMRLLAEGLAAERAGNFDALLMSRLRVAKKLKQMKRLGTGDYLTTLRRANVLSSLGVIGRNIASNTGAILANEISKPAATLVDRFVSRKYGTPRTLALPTPAELMRASSEAVTRGIPEALQTLAYGVSETQLDLQAADPEGKYHYQAAQSLKFAPGLATYINVTLRAMGAADRPFFAFVFAQSYYNQAKLAVRGLEAGRREAALADLLKRSDPTMQAIAVAEAEYVTFARENELSRLYREGLQKLKNYAEDAENSWGARRAAGLLRFALNNVILFDRVPTNVLLSTLDYAGASAPFRVKSFLAARKGGGGAGKPPDQPGSPARPDQQPEPLPPSREEQHAFALGLGRSLTGLFTFLVGGGLAAYLGLATGEEDERRAVRNLERAAGISPNSVKIGDAQFPIGRQAGPGGGAFSLGASAFQAGRLRPGEEKLSGVAQTGQRMQRLGAVAAKQIGNLPLAQGVESVVQALKDTEEGRPQAALGGFAKSFVRSLIPAPVGEVAEARDRAASGEVVRRRTDSLLDAAKARIPGLRETLPERRDLFGAVETQPAPENMLRLRPRARLTPGVREALRLGLGFNPPKPDVPARAQSARGEALRRALDEAAGAVGFQRQSDGVRREVLKKYADFAREQSDATRATEGRLPVTTRFRQARLMQLAQIEEGAEHLTQMPGWPTLTEAEQRQALKIYRQAFSGSYGAAGSDGVRAERRPRLLTGAEIQAAQIKAVKTVLTSRRKQ
jgi:hypothetical protein